MQTISGLLTYISHDKGYALVQCKHANVIVDLKVNTDLISYPEFPNVYVVVRVHSRALKG